MKNAALIMLVFGGLLLGCEQKQAEAPAPAEVKEPVSTQAPLKQVTENVVTQVEDAVEQGRKAADEVVKQVAEKTQEVSAKVQKSVDAAVAQGQEVVSKARQDLVKQGQQALAKVTKSTEGGAASGLEGALGAVVSNVLAPEPQEASPAMLVLANDYGEVNFPHAAHGANVGCTPCHGDGAPGPLELDMKTAHDLCKGCHADKGKGPTRCTDCHKK